ncbi:MAG: DNA/RNA nuclease SfsA [Candidatus Thorarchaeota archaeon]
MSNRIIVGEFDTRPNRFLGMVKVDDTIVEAHIPNPGRMYELMIPGKKVFLREVSSTSRRTKYTMIAIEHDGLMVSLDSNLPNRFIKTMLLDYKLDMFSGYETVKPEPKVYNGRFDFKLSGPAGTTLIEVKSCTLVEEGHALFPDSPTIRGTRHLLHLAKSLKDGIAHRAAVVFVIQRPDAVLFSPNEPTDPKFALALRSANSQGVEIFPLVTRLENWELKLEKIIPFDLNFFNTET